jgi:hypothetical protein
MTGIWEDDEAATQNVEPEALADWQRDILKIANSEEWPSFRKFLLYMEKQTNHSLYSKNISRQELSVGKLIGKAGAYREIINLPQELKEKNNG